MIDWKSPAIVARLRGPETNSEIARDLRCTPERVRQVRKRMGIAVDYRAGPRLGPQAVDYLSLETIEAVAAIRRAVSRDNDPLAVASAVLDAAVIDFGMAVLSGNRRKLVTRARVLRRAAVELARALEAEEAERRRRA